MFKESDQIEKFEPKVWLSSPTMHGEEFEFLKEAYETNWMSTVGRNIDEVEHQMAEIIGCKYAVGLSAGTAALHLAMKLAGVKKGMKVFCSDLTFDATVNPVIYEGGVPVFIDTEYDTWNMDPVALEKAFELYPDVRVVVVAHLYGTPGKIDEIRAICEKHNALIVEDAAESLGAKYKEVQTGTFGDIGCISFNGNKIITGSSGGMLLTNDLEAAEKAKKWSTQSREDAPWYQHEELGYNYRMSNVIAILYYCAEHGWEVVKGVRVSGNQVAAYFHSVSAGTPVSLIYKLAAANGGNDNNGNTTTGTSKGNGTAVSPKTGQNSMIPVAGMAVVLLGIGAFAVVRSRKEI